MTCPDLPNTCGPVQAEVLYREHGRSARTVQPDGTSRTASNVPGDRRHNAASDRVLSTGRTVRIVALDAVPRNRHIGRALLPLGLVCLAVGVSMAVVVPFNALFLSTAVHAGPVRVTVFL